jgi:hypothetical protein
VRRPILDVKVALELHPQNLVFNPAGIRELVERTGRPISVSNSMPSHLFWQWMDPVGVVQDLGPLVFHRGGEGRTHQSGRSCVRRTRQSLPQLDPDEPRTNLGGHEWANEWPKDAAWDFRRLGRGHDAVLLVDLARRPVRGRSRTCW